MVHSSLLITLITYQNGNNNMLQLHKDLKDIYWLGASDANKTVIFIKMYLRYLATYLVALPIKILHYFFVLIHFILGGFLSKQFTYIFLDSKFNELRTYYNDDLYKYHKKLMTRYYNNEKRSHGRMPEEYWAIWMPPDMWYDPFKR